MRPRPRCGSVDRKQPRQLSRQLNYAGRNAGWFCENRRMQNIFITVDAAGNPVDGVMLVQSPTGELGNVQDKTVRTKGPQVEFIMWKFAEYAVYVTTDGANPGSTDIARLLHSTSRMRPTAPTAAAAIPCSTTRSASPSARTSSPTFCSG